MTFEEFINKKKIDLGQFKSAEPGLFSEFESHYSQMGEKSFDHSKKFLFNKLRRAYHLVEEPKPVPAKETVEVNKIASQAEPLLSPTVEATVYTPRFRAGGSGAAKPESQGAEPVKSEKPAYTPRFKAKPAEDSPSQTQPAGLPLQTSDQSPADKPKPAYVPRFKAASAKKEDAPLTSDSQPSDLQPPASDPGQQGTPEDKPKPAYVPRFKAAAAPKPVEKPDEETGKPKPAYVPRFKAPLKKPSEAPKDPDNPETP